MFGPFLRHFVPFYGHRVSRRHLDGLYVKGLDEVRALAEREPLIVAATHVCWWDGIVMLTLGHALGVEVRFLVDQGSVDELPFLKQLGAIGLDRSSVATMLPGLEEAAAFLDRPRRVVWMFPQGRYRLPHLRPLGLQKGVRILATQSRARVVPVAMQLGYFQAHLPACAVSLGAPLPPGRDVTERLEAALVAQLDELDAWLDEQHPGPGMVPFVRSGIVPIEQRWAAKVWLALRAVVYGLRDLVLRRPDRA